MTQTESRMAIRTITLEEHYATPALMDGPGRQITAQAQAAHAHSQVAAGYAQLIEQLCDLGDHRIADMDAARIDVQVLSLTSPGVEQLDAAEAVALARDANDRVADAVRRHPSRLAAFAALPTAAQAAAHDELERMVRHHGYKGALINGHSQGRYLDDSFFCDPIWRRHLVLRVRPTRSGAPQHPVCDCDSAIVFHAMSNVSQFSFPNNGSHYDPFFAFLILALTAAIIIVVWGPETLARYRSAHLSGSIEQQA